MIPKDSDHNNPANYRPITCLQTIYKILTSCISELIYDHLAQNNIMAEEQKGCRKHSQGCKEQLIIDTVVMKLAIKNKRDINTMYIDYRKAFDSVPHSWLLHVLHHYKIHPSLITFLQETMTGWKTKLKLINSSVSIETEEIPIRRGIFQGDALSPLWFCLALNPLSNMLNRSNSGYKLTQNSSLTHLMYMDDIKLYSNNIDALYKLADITQTFSRDIHMEFGIDKCKTFSVRDGVVEQNNYTLYAGAIVEALDQHSSYKYLGFQQLREIHQNRTKTEIIKKFTHRLNNTTHVTSPRHLIPMQYLYSPTLSESSAGHRAICKNFSVKSTLL